MATATRRQKKGQLNLPKATNTRQPTWRPGTLCKGMDKMNQNIKLVRDELDEIKTTISSNYDELNAKLNEYMQQNAELEDRLDMANDRIDALTECNRELYLDVEKAKDDKKPSMLL